MSTTQNNRSILDVFIKNKHNDIEEILEDPNLDLNIKFAMNKDIKSRKFKRDYVGETPLMIFIERNSPNEYDHNDQDIIDEIENIIKLMVKKGADLNETDNNGKTALQYAEENGYNKKLTDLLRPNNRSSSRSRSTGGKSNKRRFSKKNKNLTRKRKHSKK
jgi:ankyrin repeat protein